MGVIIREHVISHIRENNDVLGRPEPKALGMQCRFQLEMVSLGSWQPAAFHWGLDFHSDGESGGLENTLLAMPCDLHRWLLSVLQFGEIQLSSELRCLINRVSFLGGHAGHWEGAVVEVRTLR